MNQNTQTDVRDFYNSSGRKFSQKRDYPWAGFRDVLTHLPATINSVLDAGCGNGRFGAYLFANRKVETYVGVDTSTTMLDEAKHRFGANPHVLLKHGDITQLPEFSYDFDLVVCFGVLHHVRSYQLRTSVLRYLYQLLDLQGVLAVTFWQFGYHERFTKNALSLSNQNKEDKWEKGDYLLGFDGQPAVRYCHHFSNEEIDKLISCLPGEVIGDFCADGKQQANRYIIWKKNSS